MVFTTNQAEVAQTDAEYKRSRCGRKTKLNDKLRQIILNHLRLSWSPEMIAHEFKLATKSIYNWLNQGEIEFSLNDLPEHGFLSLTIWPEQLYFNA